MHPKPGEKLNQRTKLQPDILISDTLAAKNNS